MSLNPILAVLLKNVPAFIIEHIVGLSSQDWHILPMLLAELRAVTCEILVGVTQVFKFGIHQSGLVKFLINLLK